MDDDTDDTLRVYKWKPNEVNKHVGHSQVLSRKFMQQRIQAANKNTS